jgi:hypothetical protein
MICSVILHVCKDKMIIRHEISHAGMPATHKNMFLGIKVPEEKDIFAALLIRHGRYRKY